MEYDYINMLTVIAEGARAVRLAGERQWHTTLQNKFKELHPSVIKAIHKQRPDDWHNLLLQWPHISEIDPKLVAYTRDDAKGEADIQTRTTIGKYLKAHFSTMPDHVIRDIVALYSPANCEFVHTMEEMIHHLKKGPISCMVWKGVEDEDQPYQAYATKLGWHMAVRIEENDTVGRALCNEKDYVRSYSKARDGGYSYSDQHLEAWLKEEGYRKRDNWGGFKLARIEADNNAGFIAPYLDGDCQEVTCNGDNTFTVERDGSFRFNNTSGEPEECNRETCEQCGDDCVEDDLVYVGRQESTRICTHCQENHYVLVTGRRGYEYYMHQDDTVYVEFNDTYYDESYLSDNDIVQLENGEYLSMDEAVLIDDSWYATHDDDVVQREDEEWDLKDNCWNCDHSKGWYSNHVKSIETACGDTIHPDFADEYETESAE